MEYPLAYTYGARNEQFLQSADDYRRQRHRVNKKLKKLRHSLNIVTKDTKHYAEKNKTSTICAENYDMDPLFGAVLLFQIERDLLYAQETRLLLDVHTSKSKEKFLITKYKKALKIANQLISTIQHEQDQYKVLEILTYSAIIDGSLSIARKKYNNALYAFSVARCCLQFLYTYQKLPEIYTKEFYYDIIDTVVDPALKVAALQTKNSRISDLSQLSKEQITNNNNNNTQNYLSKAIDIMKAENASYITPSSENETEMLKEITWGSYTAKISSNDLSLAIMKVNEELKKVVDSDPSSYDSPLILYQDAINLHSQEMERSGNNIDEDDSENQEQHIILTYLKYNYILLRIRRDITIMKELDKKADTHKNSTRQQLLELWKDCIKLNESVLSSFEEIKELPGIANDDDIMDMLTTLEVYFQIKKQLRLSQAYLISYAYVKSLALVANADRLIGGVKPLSGAIIIEGNLPTNEDLQQLKVEIAEEKSKLFILASYFNTNKEISSVGSEYLIDDVQKFPEESSKPLLDKVSPLTIDFQPVNVKPVLFDIAYNYIKYDDKESSSTQNISTVSNNNEDAIRNDESDVNKKKGGFFGLFGR